LSNGYINQLIKIVGLYQIQSFFKFGIQASAETISVAGITVCMISRVLAQVVENLRGLHDGAGSLSQVQKFIKLAFNESLRYMMRSEGGPELIPGDNMIGRLHGVKMIPP
jgi:hypothetical protein